MLINSFVHKSLDPNNNNNKNNKLLVCRLYISYSCCCCLLSSPSFILLIFLCTLFILPYRLRCPRLSLKTIRRLCLRQRSQQIVTADWAATSTLSLLLARCPLQSSDDCDCDCDSDRDCDVTATLFTNKQAAAVEK